MSLLLGRKYIIFFLIGAKYGVYLSDNFYF